MKVTVVTPNRNGDRFLERTVTSVLAQREAGVDLEYIVLDACSTDSSGAILARHAAGIDRLVVEPDNGPASAINKGLRLATGDLVAWLNADDFYHPGALTRAVRAAERDPARAFWFGRCLIVNEQDREIRRWITRFKELFFPFSSRFVLQCINYLSQPAVFMSRRNVEKAGFLREDLKAAWDYEYFLRLWRQGGAGRIRGAPLSAFRWHGQSISGQHFEVQFREEYEAAAADAGARSLQALIHRAVRWGIVAAYRRMARGCEPVN